MRTEDKRKWTREEEKRLYSPNGR